MRFRLGLVIFLAILPFPSTAGKILFITSNLSNSLVLYAGRMADILVGAGHDVTMFIYELMPANKMNGTKLAKVYRMERLGSEFESLLKMCDDVFACDTNFWERRTQWITEQMICERVLDRLGEISHLKAEKFDLAISTGTDFCDPGLAEALGIRNQAWTTTGPILEYHAYNFNLPPETSYHPVAVENGLSFRSNVWERFQNFWRFYTDYLALVEYEYRMNAMFQRKVSANFPSMAELASKAMLFVNGDEFVDPSRPLSARCINIGGVGLVEPKLLDKQFTDLIEKAKNGFILVSFGSAAPTVAIAKHKQQALVDAMARVKDIEFIVKIDANDARMLNMTSAVANIHAFSWLPQASLLAHPKIRLFVTHGGYNSLIESAVHGAPMLVVPLFFDQQRNAEAVRFKGLGEVLRPHTLTADAFEAGIRKVLDDDSYMKQAKRIQFLHQNKPNRPERTLVEWVDFLLEAGPIQEITSTRPEQSLFVYLHLDIISLAIFSLFACVYVYRSLRNYSRTR